MILSYFLAQVYIISVFKKAVLFAKEKLEGVFYLLHGISSHGDVHDKNRARADKVNVFTGAASTL